MGSFDSDAEALRKAMKGFGTDESTLIRILPFRTIGQLQQIRQSFHKLFNRDLVKDIRSELSGDLESALAGIVYVPTEYDAYQLHKAIKGLGTDEQVLTEILSHRDAVEMQQINHYYLQLSGHTLEHDLKGDLSGDTEHLYVTLAQGRREDRSANLDADARAIYEAGEGKWGTKESVFHNILAVSRADYLERLNVHYAGKYGHTVAKAVEREFSGHQGATMCAIMEPHDEYYAKLIRAACEGVGTKERHLIRVLVARRAYLPQINAAYMRLYGKTVLYEVERELSGKLKQAMTAMMTSPAL